MVAFWSFVSQYVYTEFGQTLTSRFEEIGDAICDSEWFSFPVELQKMLHIIIQAAQAPIEISGFGNISVKRETFKRVNNLNNRNCLDFAEKDLIFPISLTFFQIVGNQHINLIFHDFEAIRMSHNYKIFLYF